MVMDAFSLNTRINPTLPPTHSRITTDPPPKITGPLFFAGKGIKDANWALRVLQAWKPDAGRDHDDACRVDDDHFEFDNNSFSKFLSKVSLADARLYAQMAYLGSLSYTIPKIKLGNLLRRHRLRFVTSSLEKKVDVSKANNKEKALEEAVADVLNSSPCDWFVCDDDETSTRYFVIQGSESVASWQANIRFEPIQFEEMDVIVHTGIYEAAKAVYEQLLPQVHEHLQRHGKCAAVRLTGHSLGGSLSLLISLMLLIRGQVPVSCLLPVITFGAPWIMCGGDTLLHNLGLPRNHLQGIMLPRDIVPRVFSCNYPSQVAALLKALNDKFRDHPCLNNQNLLYAPMGELLIVQPDVKLSPSHHLLPSGSGLYALRAEAYSSFRAAAQSVFLNTPHPFEILSDRCAYGAIQRDHDVETYLTSIRQEVNRMRKQHKHGCQFWWQLVLYGGGSSCLKWLRRVATVHWRFWSQLY